MRCKSLIILLIILVIFSNMGFSQSQADFTRPVIAYPSSNVANTMNVGSTFNVDHYTGTASSSIPLGAISKGEIKIPISLNYSAGGVRVSQDAGTVGLSWSLSAGGVITRTVNGAPDENPARTGSIPKGYRASAKDLQLPDFSHPNDSWATNLSICNKKALADGQLYELTPDSYNISFNGQSVGMFFDADGIPYLSTAKKWKITGNENVGFEITDEGGTRFIFKTIENTQYSANSNDNGFGSAFTANSAWFLSMVISSTTADTVNFTYTPITYVDGSKNPDETTLTLYGQQFNPCSASMLTNDLIARKTYFSQTVNTFLLQSIKAKIQRVDFEYSSARQDFDAGFGGNKYELDNIKFYNNSTGGSLINSYSLEYDYFQKTGNSSAIGKRLALKKVKQISGANSLIHSFDYYNGDIMPARNSFGQDHWGFYNGRETNTSLIAKYDDYYVSFTGADREPDDTKIFAGLLKRITYPTGGYVDFQYEMNDYSHIANGQPIKDNTFDVVTETVSATTSGLSTSQGEVRKDFTIPAIAENSSSTTVSFKITGAIQGDYNAWVKIVDENNNQVYFSANSGGVTATTSVYLARNKKYTLIADREMSTEYGYISLSYKKRVPNGVTVLKNYGGGVRVKKIIESDGFDQSKNIVQSFDYSESPTSSSGFLLDYPWYTSVQLTPVFCSASPQNPFPYKGGDLVYFARHSSSVNPLQYTHGSAVGYSKVTIIYGENGENGKEEIYYDMSNIVDLGSIGYPYIPMTSLDALRGFEKQRNILDKNGTVIRQAITNHDLIYGSTDPNVRFIYGAKYGTYKSTNTFDANQCPTGPDWQFQGSVYRIYQVWPTLKSSTESTNDVNGNKITATSNYAYDSESLQLSKKDFTNSKNQNQSVTYKYPNSYKGQAVYDEMLLRNMVNRVVEQTEFKASFQAKKTITTFGFFNSNKVIAPSNIQIQNGSAAIETRMYYNAYDNSGNILELKKANDYTETYLWGYDRTYPVAKIINVDYNTSKGIITQTVLDNLNNANTDAQMRSELAKLRNNLPAALVSTYTYATLVGQTSETDQNGKTVYYEYDGFNHLKLIRDKDNNIIKRFDYQYQQQP